MFRIENGDPSRLNNPVVILFSRKTGRIHSPTKVAGPACGNAAIIAEISRLIPTDENGKYTR